MTTALIERTAEEVIADEIRTTRARLEALEFAYGILTGQPDPTPARAPLHAVEAAVDTPPPIPQKPSLRKGRIPEADKHAICDRAHELHSIPAAAEEGRVSTQRVVQWIEAGLGKHKGFPGNKLPAGVAADLRG